jgi:hypothetical protein
VGTITLHYSDCLSVSHEMGIYVHSGLDIISL